MLDNNRTDSALSLAMPIYDGSLPVDALLPDLRSRRIYGRLLHTLVRKESRVLDEITHWMTIELVLKALIIGQYMQQQGIEDIRKGIRQFHTFQRRQLIMRMIRRTPTIGFYGTR